jgi:membrane protein
LYNAIGQHRVVSIAAGVTFFCLLAIFPAIAALVSIYGLFADPASIQAQLNGFSWFLPGGAIEIVGDQLHRVASGPKTSLGGNVRLHVGNFLMECKCGNEGAV